jgi:hypothetical protein
MELKGKKIAILATNGLKGELKSRVTGSRKSARRWM